MREVAVWDDDLRAIEIGANVDGDLALLNSCKCGYDWPLVRVLPVVMGMLARSGRFEFGEACISVRPDCCDAPIWFGGELPGEKE